MDHKKSFIKGALSGALIMLLIVILGSGVWKAVSVRMAGGEAEAAQISALIMAGATVIGYVIGEGMTDAAAIEAKQADVVR